MKVKSSHIRNLIQEEIIASYIRTLDEETEPDSIGEPPEQPEQLSLFTPAHSAPLDAITPTWLDENSIDDELYDSTTHKLHEKGIPALLLGYESSELENEGEMFEDGFISYANAIGLSGMVRIGGEGEDLRMGNRTYESKKSKNSAPTLMFNSTFPKSRHQHFYLFTTNVPSRSQINKVKNFLDETGKDWNDALSAGVVASEDTRAKIEQINDILSNWEASSVETQAQEQEPDDSEQLPLFEAVSFDGQEFTSPTALKAYRKQLAGSKETTALLHALGANMRAYIIPSNSLRVAILQSAFPGAFKGEGQIFDPMTGDIIAGGEEKIVNKIKDYLDDFGLEYKIAEKIAPALIKDLVDGLEKKFETGWTMDMGLLGVRIKVYMEPKGRVK